MQTNPTAAANGEPASQKAASYAWYALALLTFVYVLNFLDRTLIYILFTPIKQEMGFNDTQLAFIGPTSFAILGGYTADRLRRAGRGGRMFFSACAALVSVPLWLALLFSDNLMVLAVVNFVLLGLALMWVGPAAADVHEIAGAHLRGLGIGIYFFTVTVAAYGIGSLLIAMLNDWANVTANPQMIRYTLLVCPTASALGALLLWLGSRRLEKS